MRALAVGLFVALALLSGCTIRSNQGEVLVSTTPPGASCTLTHQGQPVATVESTPGIAIVDPAMIDVAVACHRHGFAEAVSALPAALNSGPSWTGESDSEPRRIDFVLVPLAR